MSNERIAVIMAGGSGERFWPASRKLRPKQLLKLASPDESMIEQSVGRITDLVGLERVYVATVPYLQESCRAHLPQIAPERILAEPHKRNTMGCLSWFAANLLAQNSATDLSVVVLSADHLISPQNQFEETVTVAFDAVEANGGLLNLGIRPTRPETGYGYLQVDREAAAMGTDAVPVRRLKRTVEKPDLATAQEYLASGEFLWSSGMFVFTLSGFMRECETASPEHFAAIHAMTPLLAAGDVAGAAAIFETLSSISYDYAMGERATNTWTAEASFDWDDIGAWDALERTMPHDDQGNVKQGGTLALVNTRNSIVVNETSRAVGVLGMDDVVVVVTEDAILVCPKSESQRVRAVVEAFTAQDVPVS